LSKSLNPLKRYRHLLDDLPLDCVFDGEVCALDQDGRPDFNALLFRRKYPVYVSFDLLFYEREDIRCLPLKERRVLPPHLAVNPPTLSVGLRGSWGDCTAARFLLPLPATKLPG
jgi:hypothetical protein